MDCFETAGQNNRDFLARWNTVARRESVPITGSMALTHRCNLKCIHCYAGPDVASGIAGDVPTERWLRLIDEIVDAGCLFLLLTGGDPMVRSDFAEIYRHAREQGMFVTVFTNGTLVNDDILALFKELPPQVVEISLYGAVAATHDKITGVAGSFERMRGAVEKLMDNGIRLRLKSILMKPNQEEFGAIRRLVEEVYGLEFRMDAAIMPRLDGDMMPLELRVEPEVAVAHEMASEKQREKWITLQHQSRQLPQSSKLYTCGAGVIGFHVDADARLLPCLLTTDVSFDLSERPFAEGWKYIVETMRGKLADEALECHSCKNSVMCGWCPSYALLENGDANSKPEYLCELGRCRREYLNRELD